MLLKLFFRSYVLRLKLRHRGISSDLQDAAKANPIFEQKRAQFICNCHTVWLSRIERVRGFSFCALLVSQARLGLIDVIGKA